MKRPSAQGLTHAKRIEEAIELLYVSDAARYLGCSEKAVRRKIERRILPHRRLSGRIIMFRDELETFLRNLPGCRPDEAAHNVKMRSGEVSG